MEKKERQRQSGDRDKDSLKKKKKKKKKGLFREKRKVRWGQVGNNNKKVRENIILIKKCV